MKRLLKNWLFVLSNFCALIPSHPTNLKVGKLDWKWREGNASEFEESWWNLSPLPFSSNVVVVQRRQRNLQKKREARAAVLRNLLLSVVLVAGTFRVPAGLFTWRKEDPRRWDNFSLGYLQKFRSVWCPGKKRIKDGGRQKQKCDLGPSSFTGVNNYLSAELPQ